MYPLDYRKLTGIKPGGSPLSAEGYEYPIAIHYIKFLLPDYVKKRIITASNYYKIGITFSAKKSEAFAASDLVLLKMTRRMFYAGLKISPAG